MNVGVNGSGTGASLIVRALSLVESGILVNGNTVTDLLSGVSVTGDLDTGTPEPVWRGSGVPIMRLEALREMVAEVLESRDADPELTSPNPRVPRTTFPWGVGEPVTDVLVTGPDDRVTAAYLRSVGLRARCVDPEAAVRIAADLEVARAEREDLETSAVPEVPPVRPLRRRSLRRRPVVSGLATLAAVLAVVVTVVMVSAVRGGGEGTGSPVPPPSGETGRWTSAGTVHPSPAPSEDWGDPVREGEPVDPPVADNPLRRALVPVNADLPGWVLSEVTDHSEVWVSADGGSRIIVAATPTPVETQTELDARMLTGLAAVPGIRILSPSPVDYVEEGGEQGQEVTRWQVRLIDGHQVSVGCQYRVGNGYPVAERQAVCDRFTATARVG